MSEIHNFLSKLSRLSSFTACLLTRLCLRCWKYEPPKFHYQSHYLLNRGCLILAKGGNKAKSCLKSLFQSIKTSSISIPLKSSCQIEENELKIFLGNFSEWVDGHFYEKPPEVRNVSYKHATVFHDRIYYTGQRLTHGRCSTNYFWTRNVSYICTYVDFFRISRNELYYTKESQNRKRVLFKNI